MGSLILGVNSEQSCTRGWNGARHSWVHLQFNKLEVSWGDCQGRGWGRRGDLPGIVGVGGRHLAGEGMGQLIQPPPVDQGTFHRPQNPVVPLQLLIPAFGHFILTSVSAERTLGFWKELPLSPSRATIVPFPYSTSGFTLVGVIFWSI